MTDSYADSTVVFLCGPIEYWWDCPEEPDRFNSPPARAYREHRDKIRDLLVRWNYLVYSPHSAFKGPWNEKMQGINDWVVERCDILINMSPPGIPGKGTAHETELAEELGKEVIYFPPETSWGDLILDLNRIKENK